MNDMIINQNLTLSDIVDSNIIRKEDDFEYAGVKGFAEMVGYKIIFFRSNSSSFVDAISLFDIETEYEINICNLILQKIEFPFDFNSNLSEIYCKFGTELSKESILEDCDTYGFKLDESCYILFDIGEKIKGIQIICDKEIINNMLN